MTLMHIINKEIRHYIYSPIAYILAGVFHAIIGYFFYNAMVGYSRRVVEMSGSGTPTESFTPMTVIFQGLCNSMGTIFVLLAPLLTMRLIADEKRSRTMEFLATSPTPLASFLAGKFLAAWLVYLVMICSSLYIPITLDLLSRVNWSHVAAAYLGLALVGGAMISVGLFTSTLTDKQVVAAVLSIGILVICWFVGGGIGAASQRASDMLRELSLYTPFSNMIAGLIDLRDIVFLVTFILIMLFMSHRVLESDRW
ncbi:ABC-2 family transporter protein [Geobacter sp. OR-1]|uniref:ABC transporter permease n=1 Tax=Geobacter sp. OR-1 TaxID=1266765 RepID=UPI000543A5BA|nr:ABC transporter permease subunit [Geobacter sp. OR-1]GAM10207.1 ABC-2 family transporter protein [Geobacter sp. OR-1]